MYKKIKSIFYFIILIIFSSYIFFQYFSTENRNKVFKNRYDINRNIQNEISKIPILKNDSNNIIEYNSLNPKNKKIKKRYFWNLLNKN